MKVVDTPLAQWLRKEMPHRGYLLEGLRAGGISRLADDATISRASMSRIVSGQADASIEALRKIGQVFGYNLGEMMVFAGLAEEHEITTQAAEAADVQPPAPPRFEAIDGGRNLENYTEAQFDADLEAGRTPPGPPGGLVNEYEQQIWAIDTLTPAERWAALRGLRQARADARRLTAQQHAAERDQRKAR